MRDAITLFEQYSVGGVLKKQYIEENLELIGDDFLSDFTEAIIAKDTEKTLKHLAFLREKSLDVRLFLEQLLFFLRDRMKDSLQKITFGGYAELFAIFEGIYGRLKFSPDPFLLLETSTFRCIVSDFPIYGEPVAHPVVLSHPPSSLSSSRPDTHHSSPHPNPLQPSPPAPLPEGEGREGIINTIPLVSAHREGNVNLPSLSRGRVGDGVVGSETGHKMVPKSEASTVGGATGTFDFARFVEHIRTVPKRSFVGLGLRVSTYSEDGNTIVIHPDNDFNYQKLDTADVRLFLQETLDTLFGTGYAIDIRKRGAPKKASPSLVDDAMDIF